MQVNKSLAINVCMQIVYDRTIRWTSAFEYPLKSISNVTNFANKMKQWNSPTHTYRYLYGHKNISRPNSVPYTIQTRAHRPSMVHSFRQSNGSEANSLFLWRQQIYYASQSINEWTECIHTHIHTLIHIWYTHVHISRQWRGHCTATCEYIACRHPYFYISAYI